MSARGERKPPPQARVEPAAEPPFVLEATYVPIRSTGALDAAALDATMAATAQPREPQPPPGGGRRSRRSGGR